MNIALPLVKASRPERPLTHLLHLPWGLLVPADGRHVPEMPSENGRLSASAD